MILLSILAMFGGGGGSWLQQAYMDQSGSLRPDPFTGEMAKKMEERLRDESSDELSHTVEEMKKFVVAAMDLQKRDLVLHIKEVEQQIREKLPPEATRARIRAIEGFLKDKDSYTPPTWDWQ